MRQSDFPKSSRTLRELPRQSRSGHFLDSFDSVVCHPPGERRCLRNLPEKTEKFFRGDGRSWGLRVTDCGSCDVASCAKWRMGWLAGFGRRQYMNSETGDARPPLLRIKSPIRLVLVVDLKSDGHNFQPLTTSSEGHAPPGLLIEERNFPELSGRSASRVRSPR